MSITWKLTWGAPCSEVEGQCYDPQYNDKTNCENNGTCSDSTQNSESTCQGAGGTWTVNTWTPCDDPTLTV